MAPPTSDQITVATSALRTEAGTWDELSTEIGKIPGMAEGLRLTRIEAGLFQVIFDAYDKVVDQVVARTNEGKTEMTAIATTLRSVADTYDSEETAGEHRLRNLY